ncbi:MAG: peptidylprolyl isomerase [Erysipelotrichaceae bacterium]|nr:peptidylprolyl isomerase [Erysipelotrichaceae bacterium]
MKYATINVKNYGTIKILLREDIAPISVDNFISLANKGFYNGLTFHRVIKGFMIQGGCPKGNGTGGPGYTIKGEFLVNGINNPLSHKRGVISMARAMDYNSAGSQFFIVHKDATYLDGQYASFGETVSGIEVVDKIAKVRTTPNDRPYEDVIIESIKISEE